MAAGFSQSGSMATPTLRNEAESSSLALRLASSSNRASPWGLLLSVPTRLHVGHSVNTLTTFQVNREVRLSLTHRITQILAHRQENNIEDPDSSGTDYKVHGNPRWTAQIEKPHWKSAACQIPPEKRTLRRPMWSSEGSTANDLRFTRGGISMHRAF